MIARIVQGDALDRLREMPDESVHCVVTSPPYWGLRDYGTAEWIGGDSDCDHKDRIAGGSRNSKLGTSRKTDDRRVRAAQKQVRHRCRCGAVRIDRQIGLESSLDEWASRLVEVFREVRRVLRPDGVAWVNVGDAYVTAVNGRLAAEVKALGKDDRTFRDRHFGVPPGYKNKDLLGQPWLLAERLRADGWWLRSNIIWHKPNPLPESIRDRCSNCHEHVFMLSKSGDSLFWTHPSRDGRRTKPRPDYRYVEADTGEIRDQVPTPAELEAGNWRRVNLWVGWDYFHDSDAIREPYVYGRDHPRTVTTAPDAHVPGRPGNKHRGSRQGATKRRRAQPPGYLDDGHQRLDATPRGQGRNARSVWTIATEAYRGAHHATFPRALARRCILASTSARGCCPSCGAPWMRVTEREFVPQGDVSPAKLERGVNGAKAPDANDRRGNSKRGIVETSTVGWRPTCACPATAREPTPAVVLDPFGGAGTVAVVAEELGRDSVLIELNPESVDLAHDRIRRARARRALGKVDRVEVLPGQTALDL